MVKASVLVFLCLSLFSLRVVKSTEVYTVIRGGNDSNPAINEYDRFIIDSGCENQDLMEWCSKFNAEKYDSSGRCTCRCKHSSSTFLLHKIRCVANTFVYSNSNMRYGTNDCEYFIGQKSNDRPLTVVSPSKTGYVIKGAKGPHSNCSISSIDYYAGNKNWQSLPRSRTVFMVNWTNEHVPPKLIVKPAIKKFREILGRIVKLTLRECPNTHCALFKVAGEWTSSVLEPSTVKPCSTQSVMHTIPPQTVSVETRPSSSFSTAAEKKSATTSSITTSRISSRPLPSESHPDDTKTSILETDKPDRSSTAALMITTEEVRTISNNEFSGRRQSNIGAAVGGAVAAVILLLALVLAAFCVLRKRKRRRNDRPKSCPAMNNPAYVKENPISLEKRKTGSVTDEEYLTPADGGFTKPYKSLVKKHPGNSGEDDEEYTYATGDGLPSEQHYQGLVKENRPNADHSKSVKGQSAEPLYNVLEGPNSATENGSAPFYDVLEQPSQTPIRPRYVNPSKLKQGSEQGAGKATASTPLYDVLEGPNPESSQVSSQTPVYDVLEEPDVASAAPLGGQSKPGHAQTPLYDVLEGPDTSSGGSANKGSDTHGEQTYEALQPAKESIYQPLDKDI